jgi:hypothetical protein
MLLVLIIFGDEEIPEIPLSLKTGKVFGSPKILF